jgi:hypothetical protein
LIDLQELVTDKIDQGKHALVFGKYLFNYFKNKFDLLF